MLLGMAMFLTATVQAAPAYLQGLFQREPYKPLGHYYSSSPDKEECEALKKNWNDYWNELQARHQPCLDAHQGEPTASSNEGHGCSYATCAPYHNVGSQDVEARTAIKDCFGAARQVEEAEEKRKRDLEEDEKEKDKAIKEATKRHEAELEAAEKEQIALQEKADQLKMQKDRDREIKKREQEKRDQEKHSYSEGLRDKAEDWYEKALKEDHEEYQQNQQDYERDAQKLEQQAASAGKAKESIYKGARDMITAIKMPSLMNKKAIFAVGKMASGQSEEGLVDFSSAVGNTSLTTGTQWTPYQIPFRFVGDITRTTLQVSDSLGSVLSAQDIDRDWPALEAELDKAPQQYIKNVYSFENLMKNTGATKAASRVAGKASYAMLPKTWQNAVHPLKQSKIDFFYILNEANEKIHEKISNSWMNPE